MARSIPSSKLENRSKRLGSSRKPGLKPRRKPYYERIGRGCWLGYRRSKKTNGRWVLRVLKDGSEWGRTFADADDYEESNQKSVLTYFEAQTYARTLAGAGKDGTASFSDRPVTVGEAVDDYERDLAQRGKDTANAKVIRFHLKDSKGLGNLAVSALEPTDFKAWGQSFDGLVYTTTNRVNNALRAALNRAAEFDKRISNAYAWKVGLKRIAGEHRSRNVILLQPTVNAIIATAYSVNPEFGLLVEVAAQTGARFSQLVRLTVGNVIYSNGINHGPHLMVPVSRKGRGKKDITHRPLPITADLAHRLGRVGARATTRPPHAPLLMKTADTPWDADDRDHFAMFKQVVEHLKDDPGIKAARFPVTMYALRHSSIARQLLLGVSVRIVAALHDTSVEMIEKHYSEFIADHSDAISRRTLAAFAGNVIPLPSARVG